MDSSAAPPATGIIGRRQVLLLGGASIGVAALVAACGSDTAEGPLARVGAAPSTTALPDAEITDVVLLRTAASIELSIAAAYEQLIALDGFAGAGADAAERLFQDHLDGADAINRLVTAAGGERWTCTNPRFDEVVFQPVLQRIVGGGATSDGDPIPASDDPRRDTLLTAHALETLASASHQSFVPQLRDGALRSEIMVAGERNARHAAVLALIINPDEPVAGIVAAPASDSDGGAGATSTSAAGETGVPDPNVGSTTSASGGDEDAVTAFLPVHAIASQYGTLGVTQLVLGAPSESGTRYTANLETPSLNTYIYEYQSCST